MKTVGLVLFGFVFAAIFGASSVQAQVTCTGMGDNKITLGAGGAISVACSKYETPGGGATQFQMPDGTMCSFENMKSGSVACGGPGGGAGKSLPKTLTQDQFGMMVKDVQDAYAGGSTHDEIATLIHNSLLAGIPLDDGGAFGNAFSLTSDNAEFVNTTADQLESIYGALLAIGTQEQPEDGVLNEKAAGRPTQLAIIGDTQQWVLTERIPEDITAMDDTRDYYYVRSVQGGNVTFGGVSSAPREATPCEPACQGRRAWNRGDITLVDVLFPIISAGLAIHFAHHLRRRAREI